MRLFVFVTPWLLAACGMVYQAKPIQPEDNIVSIQQATPTQEGFHAFVATQAPEQSWPITQWDIDTLTLSALYFHPSLTLAKSDYAVALAGITSAGLRPQVGLNGQLSRSNQANGDINPFSYGLQVDLPIVTANKRQINIEIAQHQADIAKINVSEAAWLLRQQISVDLILLAEQQAMQANLTKLQAAQKSLLEAYQKRLDIGVAGNADMLPIRLQHDQSAYQLEQLRLQTQQTVQKILHDAGLTEAKGLRLDVQPLSLSQILKDRFAQSAAFADAATIQNTALTNRMDIQRGLALYAKAEAQLKLEMAKRYPDIALTPGILYEYGDKIWSLGIGGMLNMLNRNTDLWAQAEQVRQNEAVRFYALQHHVIQQAEQTHTKYRDAANLLVTLTLEYAKQQQRKTQLYTQWQRGLIDKVDYLQAEIQFYSAQQRLITQQANVMRALQDIENLMQKPIVLSQKMPAPTPLPTRTGTTTSLQPKVTP